MDELDQRRQWFSEYMHNLEHNTQPPESTSDPITCPCCRYPTLGERGGYEICMLCDWEDDGQDDPHADETWGGPNRNYSLTEARTNFAHHRIMYRENDPHYAHFFPQNPAILAVKEALIAVYEQLSRTDDATDRALLEQQEQAMINKLIITPQCVLPLP